jgi:ribonucleoside-diphosphate reductase alpha chain
MWPLKQCGRKSQAHRQQPKSDLPAILASEVASGANRTKSGQKAADLVQQARMQGYEGEACPECQNFTLVRNGTCLKCNTCGGTTGCS